MKNPQIVVLSDLHLGTYGCQATKLLQYLSTISPDILILNGDIIDIWNFRKSYFPQNHIEVIRKIMKMLTKGTTVYYITGNHDEALRKFSHFKLENFYIVDKLVMDINGKRHWFFHGDVFDSFNKGWSKLLAKLGGIGYDILILTNRVINSSLEIIGKEKLSFSKRVKSSVKRAIKWINDFEKTAAELAIEQNYDFVICGHIHSPQIKKVSRNGKSTIYMNSGDWVENLTSLEYQNESWKIHHHTETASMAKKRIRIRRNNKKTSFYQSIEELNLNYNSPFSSAQCDSNEIITLVTTQTEK